MDELERLYRRGRPWHGRFHAGAACALVSALVQAAVIWVLDRTMELLESAPDYAARGILGERLAIFVPALLLLVAMKGLSSYGAKYLVACAAQGVACEMRAEIYRRLVERPVGALQRLSPGVLVSRVTHDVQRLELGLSLRLTDLLIHAPAAVLILVALFIYNWRLTLVTIALVPAATLLVRKWSKKLKAASRAAQEHAGGIGSVLGETIGGIRVVKAYGAEEQEIERFARFNESLRRSSLSAYRTLAVAPPVMELLGALVIGVILALAATQVASGALEMSTATAFVAGIVILSQTVRRATSANNEMQNTIAAARRCFELIDESVPERDAMSGRDIDGLRTGIVFDRVRFAHDEVPVVADFSLDVKKGEVIALVGESGAGKTTVTDLLVRFRDPDEGRILWDSVDTREIDPRSLRARVALVTQDTVVFDDTVLRNVAYGDPSPDRERAEAACRAAHAHEFIEGMEDGYDTMLGERGARLSGGEKQRIAIARALYRDAPVLILDEATSSLDAQSEALVQEALDRLMRDRTVFVIAHRLSTVRHADRIVVMSAGRIVQEGSHDELLRRGGAYRELHRLQSGLA